MKNYNEMANDVLRRIKENEVIKKKKRKMYTKYAVSIAAMLVVTVLGFKVWDIANPSIMNDIEIGETNNTEVDNMHTDDAQNQEHQIPVVVDKDVVWGTSDNSDSAEMEFAVTEWNGKNVSSRLCASFEKDEENRIFAITAICMCMDSEYIYNDKTLAEYEAAMIKENEMIGKLESLRKIGDYLKYGEALYLTGAPDGEKWAKELYDETVSWYGEEILNEYIQNGEFLNEKLEQDLQMLFKEDAQLEYEIAVSAYINSVNMKLKEVLAEQNIVSEYSTDVDYLLIYATEEDLAKLEFENQLDWLFELAVKGGVHDMDDVTE